MDIMAEVSEMSVASESSQRPTEQEHLWTHIPHLFDVKIRLIKFAPISLLFFYLHIA